MSLESTSYHEASHAILRAIEERHIGPVLSVTVIPSPGALGSVRGGGGDLGEVTPRKLRAVGRTAIAGVVGERLAGFTPSKIDGPDLRALTLAGLLSGRGAAFVRECRAGAELLLRLNWGAVEQLGGWVRSAGTLRAPYAENLIRLALDRPPRPLMPDMDTLVRLLEELGDVSEFATQIEAAARALSARAA